MAVLLKFDKVEEEDEFINQMTQDIQHTGLACDVKKIDIDVEGEFTDIIESFVEDNFAAEGCRECHEVGHNIMPQDHKGSYKENSEVLSVKLREVFKDGSS